MYIFKYGFNTGGSDDDEDYDDDGDNDDDGDDDYDDDDYYDNADGALPIEIKFKA